MELTILTLIALLGASVFGSFGAFFFLGSKIDALGSRLDARIDAQGTDIAGRIDALGARLDARIDAQAGDIRSLRTELSARLDTLSARMDDHIRRHAG